MVIISIFFKIKVCCVYSLESPHRGDSNEYYTKYQFQYEKKKFNINCPKSAARDFFSKGLKSEFEIAMVNEPSGFEPLNVYCSFLTSFKMRKFHTYFLVLLTSFTVSVCILSNEVQITHKHQGPVVQSIISLTSSLRGQLLSVLRLDYSNILIFFVENKKFWQFSDISI